MRLEYIFLIIILIVALLVIAVVLVQNSDFFKNKKDHSPKGLFTKHSSRDIHLLHEKISQLADALAVSRGANEEANALLDKIIIVVSQIFEDKSVLSQRNGDILAQLDKTRQKYEQLEKECSDLKQQQELYKQFYLKTLNADKDEDKKFILLKEVEEFGYAVRAINAIQRICVTIGNSADYDSLKMQVNRILFELDLYKKNLGGK